MPFSKRVRWSVVGALSLSVLLCACGSQGHAEAPSPAAGEAAPAASMVVKAQAAPETGVAEWAGWVPGGKQMLVAREARGQGRYRKSFEVVRLDGLTTERVTGDITALPLFQRWQDPAWKRQTLSLR